MGTDLFDHYSLYHAFFGTLFAYFQVPWYNALICHIIFEYIENVPRVRKWMEILPGARKIEVADSFINTHIGDNISFMTGYACGYYVLKQSEENKKELDGERKLTEEQDMGFMERLIKTGYVLD